MGVKKNYYQEVTDKIISYIKDKKEIPWQKPWKNATNKNVDSFNFSISPYNPVTGTIYTALNAFSLGMHNDVAKDPRFLTFKNIKDAGFSLKKGAISSPIYFMAVVDKKLREEGGAEKEPGEETKDPLKQRVFTIKKYNVFHASDIVGIPPYELPKEFEMEFSKDFDNMKKLLDYKDLSVLTGGNRACYIPSKDVIQMPSIKQFDNDNSFYAVLLHEIGHWTKKEGRVYRAQSISKKEYAAEELVAELFSCTAALPFGVKPNFDSSGEYMKGWLTLLENNNDFIFRAAAFAERATNFCLEAAGIEKIKKLVPQIKLKNIICIEDLKFPFYGKSKNELKPYFQDIINGRNTPVIKNLVNSKTGKTFDAAFRLYKYKDEIKIKFTFPKKHKTKTKTKTKTKGVVR